MSWKDLRDIFCNLISFTASALRQGLAKLVRWNLNLQSSCISVPSCRHEPLCQVHTCYFERLLETGWKEKERCSLQERHGGSWDRVGLSSKFEKLIIYVHMLGRMTVFWWFGDEVPDGYFTYTEMENNRERKRSVFSDNWKRCARHLGMSVWRNHRGWSLGNF